MSVIAVIGAGGFVGTRLIEALVLQGHHRLRPLVRSYRGLASLCRFGSAIDVRLADAEQPGPLSKALEGAEVVVNLTTGPPAGIVRSTGAIFEASQAAKVRRLVHMSSAVVYGDVLQPIDDDHPALESHWMPYARAKAKSEEWLRLRMGGRQPEVVVLRPGIVWGVRSPHTDDIARALSGKRAYLVGDGAGIFNGIYLDNLVASIRAVCNTAEGAAGFYNVGDAETMTWREFYSALGRPLGCDPDLLHVVSDRRLPRSLGTTIDTLQSRPLVNTLYHRFKGHVPDSVKSMLRAKLEGSYQYERTAQHYASGVSVSRELWHLQRVRHKLPIAKFVAAFACPPPVPFPAAVEATLQWLGTQGFPVVLPGGPGASAQRP